VPGATLSPPRLVEWAEAETEAARHYLRTVAQASAALPEVVRQAMYARAVDNLKDSPPVFGSPAFDAWAVSAGALPFLLWLSLRKGQPRTTRVQAAELLAGPEGESIAKAVWDLWGYRGEKKSPAPPSQTPASDGGASSVSLAGADTAARTSPP